MSSRKDHEGSRQHFLDLDRETFEVGGDFWATFRVRAVERSDEIPHGFRYALTMHTPRDGRIVGYDNAHMPENLVKARRSDGTSIVAWDHKHLRDSEARHYEFRSPEQLLQDFWSDVYRVLREEGIL